ncbi:MAG: NAD-binding protein [Deltaproteobacteria bacterium]|jgi:Trk K+ transport system NAD-binding subunit|nr:NAD-binding protein [Deltaproteobacteria bacterium]
MKYLSQVAVFLTSGRNKLNMRFIMRFAAFMAALIALYSVLFHLIMAMEGQKYSTVTGLYWTLTVMSTLGFGDITFSSDLGRLFTALVIFSGLIFFMVMLPFTFIQFIYQPWLETQKQTKVPVALPEETAGHVLLTGASDLAKSIYAGLKQYHIPCFIITEDQNEAEDLFDKGYSIMRGDLDNAETYLAARVHSSAMVAALRDDLKNAGIAATVRELAPETLLTSCARHENSIDILKFAGCREVFHFDRMLGAAIGRRVFAGKTRCNIIGSFEDLCIAEVPVESTTLAGKTLLELNLRVNMGLNVAGIWMGRQFQSVRPKSVIDPSSVLLLAGTKERLEYFDRFCVLDKPEEKKSPVLVLGGGQVGQAAIENLQAREAAFRLVDKNPAVLREGDARYILGDAEDIAVLRKAGIEKVDCVAITTHNDDLNIYLTLFCRKLRPEAQIIARCNLNRNMKSLYGAGANLVMSSSTMASNAVINLMLPDSIYMLTEGLNIFRLDLPAALAGKTLRNSDLRNLTRCNVVSIRRKGRMQVELNPDEVFAEGDELILIGSTEAQEQFIRHFP